MHGVSMFWKAVRFPSILSLVIAMGVPSSLPSVGRDVGSFEGTWEGRLEVVDGGSSKDSEADKRTKAAYGKSLFKIAIHGQRASVYFGETEVKPTLFQAHVYQTNAVVFASSAGSDQDGEWVETWDFALTEKNFETLIACFSRVVNNVEVAEEKDGSKFFVLAVGELHRTSLGPASK
jgi:hypothetical protein